MKGIKLCGECANYSYKKHKCLLGCNKETDPRSKFYDDCPLPDAVEVKHACWKAVHAPNANETLYRCSKCGHYEFKPRDYCADCGAKMDGGEKDGN